MKRISTQSLRMALQEKLPDQEYESAANDAHALIFLDEIFEASFIEEDRLREWLDFFGRNSGLYPTFILLVEVALEDSTHR